ncbi:MAG: hypothetical protein IJ087_06555 [Eggerthellaceae bacterium]|nr:hypothetical protein [Eggerthellaceae bacterium]
MAVKNAKSGKADMSRIRRGKAENPASADETVTISAIITKEQKRKLAIHKAETGQSASDFIRELLDVNL